MAATNSFRDLDVWQEAMTLVEEVYRLTKVFPPDERFGLTSQLRRAAVSIPSNIGEGGRRKRRKANLIAVRLGYCSQRDAKRAMDRVARVGRMLNGLIESLQLNEGETDRS